MHYCKNLFTSIVLFLSLTLTSMAAISPLQPPKPQSILLSTGDRAYQIPWIEELHGNQPPTTGMQPTENRGEQYAKWLKSCVRIRNAQYRWYGSGTICYYDPEKKLAYVISCGHLFQNSGDNNIEIHCFYKNDTKQASIAKYPAKLLVYNRSLDISLLSFTPDWEMDSYAPIAKDDYQMVRDQTYYSCGADEAHEIACYLMKYQGKDGRSMVLVNNVPRHGRSGGGLLDEKGTLIGICWGSTNPDGRGTGGKGMFVPLSDINSLLKSKGFGWLLDVPNPNDVPARLIKIIDRTGPQKEYPKTYIPLPPG